MKYLQRIAKANQAERKQAICDILTELGVRYQIQRSRVGEHDVENIVVSFNESNHRLVVGAHFDSVEGSTGANDNASSCSVLLHLIETLKNTQRRVDFVFFDREEYSDHGSTAYLEIVGGGNVTSMINLDMCGYGNTIVVSHKGNTDNAAFLGAMDKSLLSKHAVVTVDYLPNGDDDRFDEAGIPNISVCTLCKKDTEFFLYLGELLAERKEPTEEDQQRFLALDVIATMHNGPQDSIACCNQQSIDKVSDWLLEALM